MLPCSGRWGQVMMRRICPAQTVRAHGPRPGPHSILLIPSACAHRRTRNHLCLAPPTRPSLRVFPAQILALTHARKHTRTPSVLASPPLRSRTPLITHAHHGRCGRVSRLQGAAAPPYPRAPTTRSLEIRGEERKSTLEGYVYSFRQAHPNGTNQTDYAHARYVYGSADV